MTPAWIDIEHLDSLEPRTRENLLYPMPMNGCAIVISQMGVDEEVISGKWWKERGPRTFGAWNF